MLRIWITWDANYDFNFHFLKPTKWRNQKRYYEFAFKSQLPRVFEVVNALIAEISSTIAEELFNIEQGNHLISINIYVLSSGKRRMVS